MEAHYLTDESGKRIGVVLAPDAYARLVEARTDYGRLWELVEKRLDRARADLRNAPASDRTAPEAQVGYLEELVEDVEDMVASIALHRDLEEISRGEADLTPIREALPRIEREREELRRRGEI